MNTRILNKSILALATLALAACAQPNYGSGGSEGETPSARETVCSLKLPASGRCVAWQWETLASDTTKGSLLIHFHDSTTGLPVDPAGDVAVVLWMPSMGHGSAPVTVARVSEGVYRASEVYFVMGGEWEIRIQVKISGQVQEQVVEKVSI